eukprot:514998_1
MLSTSDPDKKSWHRPAKNKATRHKSRPKTAQRLGNRQPVRVTDPRTMPPGGGERSKATKFLSNAPMPTDLGGGRRAMSKCRSTGALPKLHFTAVRLRIHIPNADRFI